MPSEHAGSEGGEATPAAGAAEGEEQAKEEVGSKQFSSSPGIILWIIISYAFLSLKWRDTFFNTFSINFFKNEGVVKFLRKYYLEEILWKYIKMDNNCIISLDT